MNLRMDEMLGLSKDIPELNSKIENVDGVDLRIFYYDFINGKTFDPPLAREFRGTTFIADTGECICRPFPKFFNVGEKYAMPEDIDWDNAKFHKKLDGSLIMTFMLNGKTICKSIKSCYSDVAKMANDLYANAFGIAEKDMISEAMEMGYTPLFELTSPYNEIVVKHEHTSMTLLGLRSIIDGKVSLDSSLVEDLIDDYMDVKDEVGHEGYVITDGNDMYKCKTSWYVDRHHTLSSLSTKTIVKATVEGRIDDILGLLYTKSLRGAMDEVTRVSGLVTMDLIDIDAQCNLYFSKCEKYKHVRSRFAEKVNKIVPKEFRPFMYLMLDKSENMKYKMNIIMNNYKDGKYNK